MALGILQGREADPPLNASAPGPVALACCTAVAPRWGRKRRRRTATTLSEVVVSAAGFEQDIKEAPASITVISREQLQEKRVSNLAQALEDVEGVDVGAGTDKTGGPNISIRGMPSDYTLILIDGRRQNVGWQRYAQRLWRHTDQLHSSGFGN